MKLNSSVRLDDAATFVAVMEEGRLRKAARRLGVAPATVSERIARLETSLGQRLLERTSRSLVPTDEGRRLFEQLRSPIRASEEALINVDAPDALRGILRLSAPPGTAALFLDALVSEYLAKHPDAKAEVVYEDRKVDATAERFDLVVRSAALLDADSYARPVGPTLRPVVIAAPDYLSRNGIPGDPADLVKHKAVLWKPAGASGPIRWDFMSETGEAVSVIPPGICT